jgi:hypothetical protein
MSSTLLRVEDLKFVKLQPLLLRHGLIKKKYTEIATRHAEPNAIQATFGTIEIGEMIRCELSKSCENRVN